MSEAAIVQILTTAFVQLGILGGAALAAWPKIREISHNTKAAKVQVQNSHETNLRDDLDGKQDETRALLGEVLTEVRETKGKVENLTGRVETLENPPRRRRWLR